MEKIEVQKDNFYDVTIDAQHTGFLILPDASADYFELVHLEGDAKVSIGKRGLGLNGMDIGLGKLAIGDKIHMVGPKLTLSLSELNAFAKVRVRNMGPNF